MITLIMVMMSQVAFAQIDPAFPLIGKSAFSLFSLYVPEAVMVSPVGLNPATLADPYFAPRYLGEVDFGHFSASGFEVTPGILNLVKRFGSRGVLRLSAYGLSSNTHSIPAVAPLSVNHSGNAWEVAYARQFKGGLSLGVAIVPADSVNTSLKLGPTAIAHGSARSDFQGRIGVLWQNQLVRIGSVYSYEQLKSSAHIEPSTNESAGYVQRGLTSGIAITPKMGTTLFYNFQRVKLSGNSISAPSSLNYWGAEQYLSPQWVVRLAKVEDGTSLNIGYVGKEWQVFASYTERALSRFSQYYGNGRLVFMSLVYSR